MKVILQRNGDFLEAFGRDAEAVAKALGTVVMERDLVAVTGIPVHAQDGSFAALHAAGMTPHIIDRDEGLKAVWRRTHADFKGTVDGKGSLMVFRRDGPTLVALNDLTPAEIARLYPKNDL
ncbi:hypothetical protein [Mesorhizobium captivum]|uniref:hypothetical protein n=1 Tax=Mesorhizobium captivum TaxID=3072319 RepID=UPI002A24A4EA|nr:hypothetical protein [Mesorhizobium sp. VK3C]MDX8445339.1 hypothetical protein [Mesorhizobium sp. VK3C]